MTGRTVADDELVWWALTVPIPDTGHRVGEDRLSRILVALAMHANADRIAWPSADSIGKSLGIDRRTVRGAFDALKSAGLIERVDSKTRSTAWRLLTPVARIPATSNQGVVAGIPATQPVDNSELGGGGSGGGSGGATGEDPRHEEKRREKNRDSSRKGVAPITPFQLPARNLVTTRPGEYCPPDRHRFLADGTCMNCEIRPERGTA